MPTAINSFVLLMDLETLYRTLLDCYGPQGWWPLYSRRGSEGYDPRGYATRPRRGSLSRDERFEIFVGTILTQNTAWRNVEKAQAALSRAGIRNPETLADLPLERLEDLIRPSGYFRQKARRLKEAAAVLFSSGEEAAPEREFLLSIKGIGPETADSLLLYVYGRPQFIADLYTRRWLQRIAGDENIGDYKSIRCRFEALLPRDVALFQEYHALIVRHGKEYCGAKPRCDGCPLKEQCVLGRESGRGKEQWISTRL